MRWSKHSDRTDLTRLSATALARGDLTSVRTCRIPRPRTEELLNTPADEAEFGLRLQLKFVPLEDEEEENKREVAEGIAQWGAFGFMFVLGVLSFTGAKPRNMSELEYEEKDALKLTDFIEHLRFARGELCFDADYIRGRGIKTRIVVRSNGTVTLETIGRGKAALARSAEGKEAH